ncbi:unnamed protein product [Discula destructiva]
MSAHTNPPKPGLVRLATASPATAPTTALTLSHIHTLAARAAATHTDLLLLPEAYIGGYPRGSGFGCVVGGRSAAGRDEFLAYFEAAVDLGDVVGEGCAGGEDAWVRRELPEDDDGGAWTEEKDEEGGEDVRRKRRGDGTREALERVAAETGVFLVVGCVEKAGGSLYCAVVYVCPRRGMIGKRRKVMPTGSERLIWAQGSPRTLRAVSTVIRGTRINMAAAICWENYMPLLRQALYAQNVNLYLAPTADNRDAWLGLMRTVGVEGRCFVVSSNMCVRDSEEEQQPTTTAAASRNGAAAGKGNAEDGAAVFGDEAFDAPPYGGEGRSRRRSCVTEEGFEIALPPPVAAGQSADCGVEKMQQQKKTRRKSVIDENGNEIVLCRAGGDGNGTTTEVNNIPKDKLVNGTATTTKETGAVAESTKFISRGGSSIVGPFGDVLAGPQWEDDESIIYTDVDFKDCIRGRLDLDAAGSYSRNDSFKFSVESLNLTPLPY